VSPRESHLPKGIGFSLIRVVRGGARLRPSPVAAAMANAGAVEGLVEVGTALAVLRRVNLLAESNALAIDIGGSLAKLLYLQPYGNSKKSPRLVIDRIGGSSARGLSVHVPSLKGTLHFFAFETRNIEQLVAFMREQRWVGGDARESNEYRYVRATGGGAYKYADLFLEEIGVHLTRLDEMACVVAGLNFLSTTVDQEVYVFKHPAGDSHARSAPVPPSMENAREFVTKSADPFPYLLVNIGSGVSIVKVTGHGQFDRVSGSSLGGGTFWGLARLLLNCQTFDDVIELTRGADNGNVDMLVADIYGGSYASLGLDADVIAASFGKVTMRKDPQNVMSLRAMWRRWLRAVRGTVTLWITFWLAVPIIGSVLRYFGVEHRTSRSLANLSLAWHFRPQDVALSLLRMVSYNIGQIAYLNAKVHGLERIYFGGNFIRDHPDTISDISFAVKFWSGGENQALFMRHDGYLGAIGAFIGACSSPSAAPNTPKRKRATVSTNSYGEANDGRGREEDGGIDLSTEAVSEFQNLDHIITASNGSVVEKDEELTHGAGPDVLEEYESSAAMVKFDERSDSSPKHEIPTSLRERDGYDDSDGRAMLKGDVNIEGAPSKSERKKRRRRKKDSAADIPFGDELAPFRNGSVLRADIEQDDGSGRVVYFDDVYHESYRLASQGEWTTVIRNRHRSSATSQSDSEDR
jgi:type II pantothenate kinase